MKPQVINGLTFEMAQTQVQGTKYKALNKFKQFTTPSFTYEDMDAEADIAIMKAWQTWKPEESKFNTYATNYINWMLYRALDTYNDVFKMNVKVKNDLKARGETYATLAKKKVTKNPEFNKEFGLDGTKEFTRELFNTYVYRTSAKTFGNLYVMNQSDFGSDKDDEDFDIMDYSSQTEEGSEDSIKYAEMDHDSKQLGPKEKIIYDMLREGHDVDSIAKELGISKAKLMQKFGGETIKKRKQAVPA